MERLNKQDMVKKIVDKLDDKKIVVGGNKYFYKKKYHLQYTQKIVRNVLTGLLECIEEEVNKGNIIGFDGYMTIKPTFKQEKKARNVYSGEDMLIPAKYMLKVVIGKRLKEACERFNKSVKNESVTENINDEN